jgi:hypothetical protein
MVVRKLKGSLIAVSLQVLPVTLEGNAATTSFPVVDLLKAAIVNDFNILNKVQNLCTIERGLMYLIASEVS